MTRASAATPVTETPATEVAGESGFDSRDEAELRSVFEADDVLFTASTGTAAVGKGGIDLGAGGGGTEGGGVRGGDMVLRILGAYLLARTDVRRRWLLGHDR